MKKSIVVAAIAIPVLELFIITAFVNWLGIWQTLLLMFATSILGFVFARKQGMQVYRLARLQMQNSQIPSHALLDGLCILFGGILLVIPGFLTDAIGLFFLIPWTRAIGKALLLKIVHSSMTKGNWTVIKRR
ncbi:FxsA family protein [Shouchella clausii]|uniref:FxsA family protein n=1 Tax=Shouchella clausii TaxID=79880 RepID=UPI0007999D33|nr:FxsA family protein [Shouchella clausii]KKI86498.1 hypothetical protein WZ76_10940 [Shouchella clausii]